MPPSSRLVRVRPWLAGMLLSAWMLVGLQAVPVRVATFNVENGIAEPGSDKYEAAKAILQRMDADVIAFQELRRSSATIPWEEHWQQLANELGYVHAFGPGGTTMAGSHRLGYFSRFPIVDVQHLSSPSGANELTRRPMRVVIEVPGAARPLVLWNMHHKANEGTDPVLLERNQFRRAVEAQRIVQDIDAYRAAHPDHEEFVVLGDLNADVFTEQQATSITQLPFGLPLSYSLGSDISFPVAYRFFPDERYGDAGGGMWRVDAFQQNSTVRHTFPSWPSVLDYVIVSTALYQGPAGPLVGEVYNSARDAAFPNSGLPKVGNALPASFSRTASDHLPVFVDVEMADAVGAGFAVGPEESWAPSGLPGGPFLPAQQEYTLQNPGPGPLGWSAQVNVPWLEVSAPSGTVPAGTSQPFVVSLISAQLPTVPGTYFGTIEWMDVATGDRLTRLVVLSVLQPGRLTVSPTAEALVAGPPGGAFFPAQVDYTLTNPGQTVVSWSASVDAPWVGLSATAGQLAPGASINVTTTITAAANVLPEGSYRAVVSFVSASTGEVAARDLRLEVRVRDDLTQQFTGGINLAGQSLTFAPDGSGSYYFVRTETASGFPSDPVGGTNLTLGDDAFAAVELSGGASLPFFGVSYPRVFVGSNGYLTFGQGDTAFSMTLANHFRLPRISALYTDLDPSRGGQVSWRQWPDRLAVTYQNVREFSQANANTFQVEMFFDGRLRITYLTIDASAGVVGLSRGEGQPPGFNASNFATYPSAVTSPWGRPVVGAVAVDGALLTSYVVRADLGGFSAHGYVLARADLQPQPALGDASSGAVEFDGPPPPRLEVMIEGLEAGTTYAVRAYAVQGGQVFYSPPATFATARGVDRPPYYTTGFEDGRKSSYTTGVVTFGGVDWVLDDALVGREASDMKNGDQAVRLRNGSLAMVGFLDRGVGSVSFLYARSNFSGDRSGVPPEFVVEYATVDAPETWQPTGPPISLAGVNELTPFVAGIDVAGEVRLRIRKTGGDAGKRWNIDDFAVTPFETNGPAEPVVIGSDLSASAQVGVSFTYQIPATGDPDFYEMEAVPAGLTFDPAGGSLTGTPQVAGQYELTVAAGNALGSDSATFLLEVARGRPVVFEPPIASGIFAGQSLADSTLAGGAVSVPGTFLFDDPSRVPGPGNAQQAVVFVPDDTTNYEPVVLTVAVEVDGEVPVAAVTLGGLQTSYNGSPRPVTVTTDPPGLHAVVTYDGSPQAPVAAGVYEVVVLVDDSPYIGSAFGSLVINRAAPQITTLPEASPLAPGQTLGESVLTNGQADVPGTFLFATPGLVVPPGTASREVLFIPQDSSNYTSVTLSVEVVVESVITLDGLSAVYDGTPQAVTVTTDPPGLALVVTYDGQPEAPVLPGQYVVEAVVVEPGFLGSATSTLEIAAGLVEVTELPVASPLVAGQTLAESVLAGGAASQPGAFAFASPGRVAGVGTLDYEVVFSPEDTNYDTVTVVVPVTVEAVLPAGSVVAAWNMAGQPGNQTTTPGAAPPGVTALDLVRGEGLQPAAGVNAMSSNGWTAAAGRFYAFGFVVGEGREVELQELRLATRASNGGPRELALRWSVDDFTTDLATWEQANDQFLNQTIDLAGRGPLTGTVEFRVVATGTTSVAGETITPTGTLRVGNYFDGSTSAGWFGLTGEVRPTERITSAGTAQGVVGEAFNYTITATGDPVRYVVGDLPAGLTREEATGEISGTPSEPGTFAVTIGAAYAADVEVETVLILTILPAPGADPLSDWLGERPLTPALLQDYALGGAAAPGLAGEVPAFERSDTELALTVVVRENDPLLVVRGEASDELAGLWSGDNVMVRGRVHPAGPVQDDVPPGFERRHYVVPVGDNGRRFLRLRVIYD